MAEAQTAMTPNMLAAMAQQLGGTQAIPAVQRSQYLADALHSLQASGGQNLRTAGALGSNLLADALLQWKQQKNNQALMGQVQQGQSSMIPAASSYMAPAQAATPAGDIGPSGAGLSIGGSVGGSPPVQTSGPNATQVSSSPFGSGATPTPGVTPSAQALASALSPQDQDAAINTVYGEARGEPTAGRQAVAGVMANRAALTGLPLADIAAQPHQFAGYNAGRHLDPNSSIYKSIMTDIMPVLNGQAPNPAGTADHFYAPGAMPNGAKPSWDNGSGQMIGNQDFLSLGYGGKPALTAPQSPASGQQIAAAAPPALVSAPPTSAGAAGPAGGQPYQVASLGMPPGPPQGGGGGVPPAGPVAPSPAAGPVPAAPMPQQVAQAPGGPPTGPYATPGEAAYIQERLSHPVGSQAWQMGVLKAQEIQQRRITPMTPPKDMMWGPNGQAVPVPGMMTRQLGSAAPGEQTEQDAMGHRTYSNVPGAVTNGQQWDAASNSYKPLTGLQPVVTGTPAPGSVVSQKPGEAPTVVQGPQFPVSAVGELMKDLTGSQQYDKATKLTEMYRGMVAASARPGGITDAELKDNAAQIFSGGVARQFNAKMIDEGQGPLLALKQFGGLILSGQKLSPEARQAIMAASHDYTMEAQGAFGALAKSKAAFAAQNGVDISPFVTPLMRDIPAVPSIDAIPGGGSGYDTHVGPGGTITPAAPGAPAPHAAGMPPGVDPASPAGQAAIELMHRGYHFQNGQWTK